MRKVLYSPAGKVHPSQHTLIDYPPEGYEFTVQGSKLGKLVSSEYVFDKVRLQVLDRLIPLNLAKGAIDSVGTPRGFDLIYAYNHIVLGNPYVVHIEWAHILSGRAPSWFYLTRSLISSLLRKKNCKRIITWTQAARESILDLYGNELSGKIAVIPPALPSKQVEKTSHSKQVNLLFIGSSNQANDFEEKGGHALVEAFSLLRERYKEKVHLTIRAQLPRGVSRRLDGVTVYELPVTVQDLDRLYRKADIFVLPTYLYQNTAVIEAMAYGLPVVTTRMGASLQEYVEDGSTGLVVSDENEYLKNGLLLTETTNRCKLIKYWQSHQGNLVGLLVSSISLLVDSPSLRHQLGSRGKREVDTGKFSIGSRNKKLKEIFDEALA